MKIRYLSDEDEKLVSAVIFINYKNKLATMSDSEKKKRLDKIKAEREKEGNPRHAKGIEKALFENKLRYLVLMEEVNSILNEFNLSFFDYENGIEVEEPFSIKKIHVKEITIPDYHYRPFTGEEIQLMDEVKSKVRVRTTMGLWLRAFALYNDRHDKKLSMMCSPCYDKVLDFAIEYSNIKLYGNI